MKSSSVSCFPPAARGKSVLTLLLCLASCAMEDGASTMADRVWMATEPIQCLGNPWERDWLQSHNWDYSGYPRDPSTPGLEPEEYEIVRDYYSRQEIEVFQGQTTQMSGVVCAACSCPAGYTLYLLVGVEDVTMMIGYGYRMETP